MSFRRVGGLCAVALATIVCISCGEVYRPVVIPVDTTPPNPANFHEVFGVSSNVPATLGTALQIDVSGDTNIGAANMGVSPTHGLITPNFARVLIASAGTLYPGGSDVVTSFTPATAGSVATGLGIPTTFTYPNFGPNDPVSGAPQWSCSYLPDFVATTETTVAFAANYGVDGDPNCAPNLASTDSVTVLSIATTTIGLISYLPAGSHPVALAETVNAQNLYVVNQGNGTVQDMSPVDLSLIGAAIPVGNTPVWAVARPDNQRLYVLTQGDGTLVTIDTASNSVLPNTLSVGAGANFLLFDMHLNRLYVTNPLTGNVFVFAATGGANDTPVLLSTISMTAGSTPPCLTACSPVSVTALQDGSRFYVASYQNQTVCNDPLVGSGTACVVPMLTVFDALSMTPKTPTSNQLAGSSSMSLLMTPQFAASQFAVPAASTCAPAATYAPGTTRFRMFAAAAFDSSHVYVAICDAGTIADVNATTNTLATGSNAPDTLVRDIITPFSAGAAGSNNEPPPQSPIFLFSGQ